MKEFKINVRVKDNKYRIHKQYQNDSGYDLKAAIGSSNNIITITPGEKH